MKRALVLGGGGVAGIAWETGVLLGMAEQGIDPLLADVVIGTSAGSAVGAQITSGTPLAELYARHESGASAAAELMVEFDPERMMAELVPRLAGAEPGRSMRAAIGGYALVAETVPEPTRYRVIEARLTSLDWPSSDLRIVAVDVVTGESVVFTVDSGVALADAVAASCAVPGVWPPVTIGGRRYMDGGVRSSSNVDLAAGCDAVLVLAPVADLAPAPPDIKATVDAMTAAADVVTISPDEGSLAAMGVNPLDPSTAQPAAVAGRAQGASVADAVRRSWT